ncbi:MAG: hypothetical protein E5W40_15900, partial [Mesorhizobium sp.]
VGFGYALHWLVPSIPLVVAFALAAVLSPTDAVAVSSIVDRNVVPARLMHILEGESLLNDASGLVMFRFAVAAALTGSFSFAAASLSFFYAVAAGILAGGVHPSPLPYAHVVTTTTHKSLRGPRGGMILCNDEDIAKKMNSAVFPGLQGGPLMHVIAAKAVAFGEALKPSFRLYAESVAANAKALASSLQETGLDIVSGGTDNHLMLVDLRPKNATGKRAEAALGRANITCNKNGIPFDPEKPFVTSGVRLGTPAGTTRGFGQAEFREIGKLIAEVLD